MTENLFYSVLAELRAEAEADRKRWEAIEGYDHLLNIRNEGDAR